VSPVWSAITAEEGSDGPKQKRRKRSEAGHFIGKWFVRLPGEIRGEALEARDYARRPNSDAEDADDAVEFVDMAEFARLRALQSST